MKLGLTGLLVGTLSVGLVPDASAQMMRCGAGPFNSGDSCAGPGRAAGPDRARGAVSRPDFGPDRRAGPDAAPRPPAMAVGRRLPAAAPAYIANPRAYGLGPLGPGQRYALYGNHIYLIDSDTLAVLGLVRVLEAALD